MIDMKEMEESGITVAPVCSPLKKLIMAKTKLEN
jgi:hypothetical protein